ncbi:hypothetical protein HCN44_002392 [Aphidius gifuensis]|uniref:RRM domain-containing protein n=1 Tax=Aphidius gifuensis TaxID=684658 RepID=A0A834Y145_APHGI|nr:serine-arginine protein 55-like [Aphidius gifuensis]KAF7996746.1 hypothetical protein HCN44_002392 [Aphidius gifuensis]
MEEIDLSKTIFIGNLPASTNESDLKTFFQQSGQDYIEAFIQYDFAIVELDNHDNAKNSIEKLNGTEFKNNCILVEWARRPKDQWLHRSPVRSEYFQATKNKFSLKVRNLSSDVTWQDLEDHIVKSSATKVIFTDTYMNRQHNLGYVEFETENDFKLALNWLNDSKLKGKRIRLIDNTEVEIRPCCSRNSDSSSCSESGGSGACSRARKRRRRRSSSCDCC